MNKPSSNRWNLVVSLMLFILAAAPAWGQDATGRIVGNAMDQSGAPISDVTVTVTNTATSDVQKTVTDAKRILSGGRACHWHVHSYF
jgi:hypothetical protein